MAVIYHHSQWGAMRPLLGVLFDMDGLVLDSEALYTRFWREAAASLGYTMTLEQSLGLRSLKKPDAIAYLHSLYGSAIDYTALRSKRIELMDAYVAANGIAPKPGIRELLDFLEAQHIPAAITSSAPMATIERNLKAVDLLHRFTKLCSGHEVPNSKPAPDIYLHGATLLGLPPENCLALEDSPTGIRSAHAAGCLPVMIPDLDQPTEEIKPLLYAQADSLTDIIQILKNGHL